MGWTDDFKQGYNESSKQAEQRKQVAMLQPKFKSTMHLLHFFLTICTGGLWLIVWLFCGLSNSQYNKKAVMQMQMAQFNKMMEK